MAGSCGNGGFNRLDTQHFDVAIQEMKNANKAFSAAKNAIVNGVTTQLLDCWDGKGAKKFESSFKRLRRELTDREETLQDMCEDLEKAYATYAEADKKSATDIQSSMNNGSAHV